MEAEAAKYIGAGLAIETNPRSRNNPNGSGGLGDGACRLRRRVLRR